MGLKRIRNAPLPIIISSTSRLNTLDVYRGSRFRQAADFEDGVNFARDVYLPGASTIFVDGISLHTLLGYPNLDPPFTTDIRRNIAGQALAESGSGFVGSLVSLTSPMPSNTYTVEYYPFSATMRCENRSSTYRSTTTFFFIWIRRSDNAVLNANNVDSSIRIVIT
jgi:hypothetical protein